MSGRPRKYPRKHNLPRAPRAKHRVPRRAPGGLETLRHLLNTNGREVGKKSIPDRLQSRSDAERWFVQHKLLPPETELTKDDVRKIRTLREGLAAMVGTKTVETEALERLRDLADGARFRLDLGADGTPRVRAVGSGVSGALAILLRIFLEAKQGGFWKRLKVCGACQRVFYDWAQNRSTKWCTPYCGDRVRSRQYMRRQREKRAQRKRERRFVSYQEQHR